MWRKPTNAKPSSQAPSTPERSTEIPVAPKAVATPEAPKPGAISEPKLAVSPVPAAPPVPAVPPTPAYTPTPAVPVRAEPVTKVVTHDTASPSSIGMGLKIRGELSGSSDLYIEGEAQGKIVLINSRVTVGARGRVQADIEAREIVIEGSVQGNLKAHENIRLASSSNVQGSVLTPRIGIDDGAKLRGKVEMTRAGGSNAGGSNTVQSSSNANKSTNTANVKAVATTAKGE
jgi:cytoskeletal protein CcmA (bactofilin family)